MGAVRLLADENIHAALVAALRSDGIDTAYVAEEAGGIGDSEVLEASVEEQRFCSPRIRISVSLYFA